MLAAISFAVPALGQSRPRSTDAERITAAQKEAGYRLSVPHRIPSGARLLAVVVAPVPGTSPIRDRLSDYGLILTGPPYVVHSVVRRTPADIAGIRPRDILLELNGRKLDKLKPDEVLKELEFRGGLPIEAMVRRNGKPVALQMVRGPSGGRLVILKQVGFTYARGAAMLSLNEHPSIDRLTDAIPPDSRLITISDSKARLTRSSSGVLLRWFRSGMAFEVSSPKGGFSEEETMAFARSVH